MRRADDIYNDLRSKLRIELGEDNKEIIGLLDSFWDAAVSEGIVMGQSNG